jgi:hypothetical protein
MSQQELLARVVQTLDRLGVEYMVTGSVASSFQGEPRATHDIDLVVALPPAAAAALAAAFPPPDYYLPEDVIAEAIRNRSSFNLLAINEGDKVDFWLLTDEPFDRSRFTRRRRKEFGGVPLTIQAPEDTILSKLRWAELSGGSKRQFTDALGVFEVQREALDQIYLDTWARELGVEELLRQLRAAASAG